MSGRIEAPWTPEQVKALMLYQASNHVHPYTCGNRSDGKHPALDGERGILVPTMKGWICPFCDYTQAWAHAFTAEPLPAHPFERKP